MTKKVVQGEVEAVAEVRAVVEGSIIIAVAATI